MCTLHSFSHIHSSPPPTFGWGDVVTANQGFLHSPSSQKWFSEKVNESIKPVQLWNIDSFDTSVAPSHHGALAPWRVLPGRRLSRKKSSGVLVVFWWILDGWVGLGLSVGGFSVRMGGSLGEVPPGGGGGHYSGNKRSGPVQPPCPAGQHADRSGPHDEECGGTSQVAGCLLVSCACTCCTIAVNVLCAWAHNPQK